MSGPLDLAAIISRLRAAGCVFAEDEAALLLSEETDAAALEHMVLRRELGDPLEIILGWAEFRGLRIAVDRGVFVPRRRTEFLVDVAVAALRRTTPHPGALRPGAVRPATLHPGAVVLDLCCGSGAVAAAIEAEVGNVVGAEDGADVNDVDGAEVDGVEVDVEDGADVATGPEIQADHVLAPEAALALEAEPTSQAGRALRVWAADVDPAAVRCARRNIRGTVIESDLFARMPPPLRGRIDLIVANAPYVPTDDIGMMPPEARLHEPMIALDGGADGVDLQRRVISEAVPWLRPSGILVIETGRRQVPLTVAAFAKETWTTRVVTSDDLDATVVIGELVAHAGAS